MGDEIICIVRMKAIISHVHEENSKQNEEQAFLLSRGEGGFAHPVIRFLVEEAEFGIFLSDRNSFVPASLLPPFPVCGRGAA